MNARIAKSITFAFAACAIFGPAKPAAAEPIYTVTELGNAVPTSDGLSFRDGYSLQTDPSGYVHSVTSGDGSRSYVFDKSPTTQVYEWTKSGFHQNSYSVTTLRNGSHSAGYSFDQGGGGPSNGPLYSAGLRWSSPSRKDIVSDLNSRGQFIGFGEYQYVPAGNSNSLVYAAASGNKIADLNFNIQDSLGIYLTYALKIDDLGQIIARGFVKGSQSSELHDYLLTPNGPPISTPEPSTLIVLGAGMAALIIRSKSRRRRAIAG